MKSHRQRTNATRQPSQQHGTVEGKTDPENQREVKKLVKSRFSYTQNGLLSRRAEGGGALHHVESDGKVGND